MEAWGGERGRGEDLTDWTPGGNLEWERDFRKATPTPAPPGPTCALPHSSPSGCLIALPTFQINAGTLLQSLLTVLSNSARQVLNIGPGHLSSTFFLRKTHRGSIE